MLFLYIFSFLTIVTIVLFIWLRRPKPAHRVEVEVPVEREHYIYWLPWSNGWGGGNTTFIDRPRPHFAGISTEHAGRTPRELLLD